MSLVYTKNLSDSEDLVQNGLIKALDKCHQYDSGKGALLSWLSIMIRRMWYDKCRKDRYEFLTLKGLVEYGSVEQTHDFGEVSDMDKMLLAVEELPKKYKDVIEMRLKGRSIRDISNTLDIPEGTVKPQIFRAKGKLREILHVE